jgi:hypothetical protein
MMPRKLTFEHLQQRGVLALAASIALSSSTAIAQPCPPEGDAKQALARELNPFKNREDAPPVEKINANATLNAVLAPGNDLQRWSRTDAATFEGVVVGVKVGGIESVNCHAKDPPHRDTHIELALDLGAPETQRVIVEVTPRWREKMAVITDWSTPALKKRLLGRRVRITGWLFDDLEHQPEAENTNPGALSNWRATVWEIHPITGITVLPPATSRGVQISGPPDHPTVHHRARPMRKCTKLRHRACRKTTKSGRNPTRSH